MIDLYLSAVFLKINGGDISDRVHLRLHSKIVSDRWLATSNESNAFNDCVPTVHRVYHHPCRLVGGEIVQISGSVVRITILLPPADANILEECSIGFRNVVLNIRHIWQMSQRVMLV